MRIWHDRSYITREDQEMISLGYAAEDFYSLRLSFVYSEDECARNRKLAMASEDNTRIRAAQMRSDEIESVVEAIAGQCACYQYRSDKEYPFDSDSWDLFFWCNSFLNTLPGVGGCRRDYSYVTLTFNSRHTPERRKEICEMVLNLIRTQFSAHPHLDVAVQYCTRVDQARIDREVSEAESRVLDKPCSYHLMEGRIIKHDGDFFFLKKRCRKYGYRLSGYELLRIAWSMGIETARKAVPYA